MSAPRRPLDGHPSEEMLKRNYPSAFAEKPANPVMSDDQMKHGLRKLEEFKTHRQHFPTMDPCAEEGTLIARVKAHAAAVGRKI